MFSISCRASGAAPTSPHCGIHAPDLLALCGAAPSVGGWGLAPRRSRALGLRRSRLHDLRHIYGAHFAMASGSIYDLNRNLGHHSVGLAAQVYRQPRVRSQEGVAPKMRVLRSIVSKDAGVIESTSGGDSTIRRRAGSFTSPPALAGLRFGQCWHRGSPDDHRLEQRLFEWLTRMGDGEQVLLAEASRDTGPVEACCAS